MLDTTRDTAPPRTHYPPTRRQRLDQQLAQAVLDVLAAQNRLLARKLGLVAR